MKPFSQQTFKAIVQFQSSTGKFYIRTEQRWLFFTWWDTVGKYEHEIFEGNVFYPTYFNTKEEAESYCKRVGLTLI
jgi:hypothetical protein